MKIKEIIAEFDWPEDFIIIKGKVIPIEDFILNAYNSANLNSLADEYNCSYRTIQRTLVKLPVLKGNGPLSSRVSLVLRVRTCKTCGEVKHFSDFGSKGMARLNSECKICWRPKDAAKAAASRAAKDNRTPPWTNLETIANFYKKCPEKCQVDHIVPLRGKTVSGLHTEDNLQYLTADDNIKKGNKFDFDEFSS